MKNNKGFSLVELIVVIAILAILSGIITISLGTISEFRVKETSGKLVGYLNKARTAAMSKRDNEVVISYDEAKDCYYIKLPGSQEQVKVSDKGIKIYYYTGSTKIDENTEPVLIENALKLSFDRSSGAYNPLSPGDSLYVFKLKIARGSHSKHIGIVPPTGKISLE